REHKVPPGRAHRSCEAGKLCFYPPRFPISSRRHVEVYGPQCRCSGIAGPTGSPSANPRRSEDLAFGRLGLRAHNDILRLPMKFIEFLNWTSSSVPGKLQTDIRCQEAASFS